MPGRSISGTRLGPEFEQSAMLYRLPVQGQFRRVLALELDRLIERFSTGGIHEDLSVTTGRVCSALRVDLGSNRSDGSSSLVERRRYQT